MEVVSVHPFRVTRNADVRHDEEEAEDLLEMISAELRERRFAQVVRLEVDKEMPESERQLLMRELELDPEDVHEVDGLLDLTGCFAIAGLHRVPSSQYEPWEPVVPPRLKHEGEQGTQRHLRHHPPRGPAGAPSLRVFAASTERLIEEAADDERGAGHQADALSDLG